MTEKTPPNTGKTPVLGGFFTVYQAVGFRERSSQIEAIFSAS